MANENNIKKVRTRKIVDIVINMSDNSPHAKIYLKFPNKNLIHEYQACLDTGCSSTSFIPEKIIKKHNVNYQKYDPPIHLGANVYLIGFIYLQVKFGPE